MNNLSKIVVFCGVLGISGLAIAAASPTCTVQVNLGSTPQPYSAAVVNVCYENTLLGVIDGVNNGAEGKELQFSFNCVVSGNPNQYPYQVSLIASTVNYNNALAATQPSCKGEYISQNTYTINPTQNNLIAANFPNDFRQQQ